MEEPILVDEPIKVEAGLSLPEEDDLKEMSVDDLNSFLNAAVATLKEETQELPSEVIRKFVLNCLKHLANYVNEEIVLNVVALSWPSDIKTVAQRLFQTYNIDDQYICFSFMSLNLCGQIAGTTWLASPPKFLQLVASLSAGRLRIITENPQKIDEEMLASCLRLLELCIKCIEDESCNVSDNVATAISRSCQEAASFCCEYLCACTEEKIGLKIELQLAFYRFVCLFASIGGVKIVNKDFLKGAMPSLLNACDFALNQRDLQTASLLLINIQDFPFLCDNTLDIVLKYLQLAWPTEDKTTALCQITTVLEELHGRTDFYNKPSVQNALEFAKNANDSTIIELLNRLS